MSVTAVGQAPDTVHVPGLDARRPATSTDGSASSAAVEDQVVRVGLRRFHRLFNVIVGAFGVLFALQTGDSFVADLPTMRNPLGVVVIALVVLAVLAGLGPIVLPKRARALFLAGVGSYSAALLLWPWTIAPPIPTDPMPWLVAVWPVAVVFAAQVTTSRTVTILGGAALSAYTGVALLLGAGLDPVDSAVNSLFMLGIAVVLVLLLGVVRRGIVSAAEAQQAALDGFATSSLDEATETERKRTDALLHDAVLTTFLSAAAARTEDADLLARRMAANALRVLMHVNGVDREDAAMPFGRALEEERERLAPLARFEVDLGASASIMLPEEVARAVVGVLLHAADNSVRHAAGATRRTVAVTPLGPDGIRVHVEDDGCGFDPATVRTHGLGHGTDAVRRLRAVEGRVDVVAAPGGGTRVTVSWGSVVMVGTTPLDDERPLLVDHPGATR